MRSAVLPPTPSLSHRLSRLCVFLVPLLLWQGRANIHLAGAGRMEGPTQVQNSLRANVWGSTVSGTTGPRQSITVTLRTALGDIRAVKSTVALATGFFDVNLVDTLGRTVAIRPTDLLEVTEQAGDPLLVRVPDLSAHVDLSGNAVVGQASPGAEVRVSIEYEADGSPGEASLMSVRADDDGLFRADFSGHRVLRRGMGGNISLVVGRVLFVAGWAASRMTVDLAASFPDQPVMQVNVPAGQTASLQVLDPAGRPVMEAVKSAGFSPGLGACCMDFLTLLLRSPDGRNIRPQAGDRMVLSVGEGQASMTLPPLSATAFASDDRIVGRSAPDAVITIDLRHNPVFGVAGNHRTQVTADAEGRFAQSFSGAYDLRSNDRITISVETDGHILRQPVLAPGLSFNLDDGTISGGLAPDARVSLIVSDDLGLRGTAVTHTGPDGQFLVQPQGVDGRPVRPMAGDRVLVQALDGRVSDVISAVVPEFTMSLDRSSGTVGGRVTPGGELFIQAKGSEFRVGDSGGVARPTQQADGSYMAEMKPPRALGRGNVVEGRYRGADEHMAFIRRVMPAAKVELGGATVCGYASAGSTVEAKLVDITGRELARAQAPVSTQLRYELQLRDAEGQLAISRAGQTVTIKDGTDTMSMTLPAAAAALDPLAGVVRGEAPAGSRLAIIDPTDRCFFRDSPSRDSAWNLGGGKADDSGRFLVSYGSTMRPGEGLQVTLFDSEDNAVYLSVYRLLGRVFVGSPRVAGRMSPGLEVAARLLAPDQTQRGGGLAIAGPDGRFDLRLRDTDGQTVAAQAGDLVLLESGGQQADVRVKPLDFDYSPEIGVLGRAPAQATVRVDLETTSGRNSFVRSTDLAGSFRFIPADVPIRAGWTLDDVRLVRATLFTDTGHELVVESVASGMPGPTSTASATKSMTPIASATITPRPTLSPPAHSFWAYLPRLSR